MFKPRNLFRSLGVPKKTVSGEVQTPGTPSARGDGKKTTGTPCTFLFGSTANTDSAAAEYMRRRVDQFLKAGRFPKFYFFGVDPVSGGIAFLKGTGQVRWSLLIFTTPLSAKDYLRVVNNPSSVAGFNMDHLPLWSKRWKQNGFDSIVVNPCPRCARYTAFQLKDGGLVSKQVLELAVATSWAQRIFKGEPLVHQFMAQSGDDAVSKKRAILETLRDHVDCCVPYVYELIALFASLQRDEEARSSAILKIQEFGPQFTRSESHPINPADPKSWAEPMAKATMGLLASFGMLNLKQQPPATQVEGADKQVIDESQGNSTAGAGQAE